MHSTLPRAGICWATLRTVEREERLDGVQLASEVFLGEIDQRVTGDRIEPTGGNDVDAWKGMFIPIKIASSSHDS